MKIGASSLKNVYEICEVMEEGKKKGLESKLFKGDRSIWMIFMFLCAISLLEVYSASSTLAYKNAHFWETIVRHATFLFLGFGFVLIFDNIPNRFFSALIILLPISIILLVVTPFIGVNVNEAHRFLSFMGIQFQPSEFAKLACVVYSAYILSRKPEKMSINKKFWFVLVAVCITCFCIVFENFSTAFLLFAVCYLMMFVGQIPLKRMGLLTLALIVFGLLLIVTVRSVPQKTLDKCLPERAATWIERINDHIGKGDNGNKFELNEDNFQVAHAKIAIARGGLFGKLPGRSVQRDFLPQAYSDFIYAIIIEELGLIPGGIGVLLLYIFLMFRVAVIARKCEKPFPRYLALGCGLLIVVQALTNMAVAVNLIPVTGQPLPLISRGGTSTMLTCFYFGIILSISRFSAGMGDEDDEDDTQIEEVELKEGEELIVDIQEITK
jgi:cell division protein FtsW